jgi:uncharacterized glyoxalase superfamily protein PhnB
MSTVRAIPAGHRTVTPYLTIKNAAKALEFYKKAFGATETYNSCCLTDASAMRKSASAIP